MSEIILKPCPFCGCAKPHVSEFWHEFWVKCDCGATTEIRNTKEEACELWNRRPREVALKEQITKLQNANEALRAVCRGGYWFSDEELALINVFRGNKAKNDEQFFETIMEES